jgi:fatty acid-binding protein DegV
MTISIACIPKEQAKNFKIRIVPANIFFNGNLYRDLIDLIPAQAYEFLDRAPHSGRVQRPLLKTMLKPTVSSAKIPRIFW